MEVTQSEVQALFQPNIRDLTSVVFPPEDQAAIFNREIRIAIYNGRTLGRNSVLEGVWLGLLSLGAISEWHYQNLIAANCNVSERGGWRDMEDDTIIARCGGVV